MVFMWWISSRIAHRVSQLEVSGAAGLFGDMPRAMLSSVSNLQVGLELGAALTIPVRSAKEAEPTHGSPSPG